MTCTLLYITGHFPQKRPLLTTLAYLLGLQFSRNSKEQLFDLVIILLAHSGEKRELDSSMHGDTIPTHIHTHTCNTDQVTARSVLCSFFKEINRFFNVPCELNEQNGWGYSKHCSLSKHHSPQTNHSPRMQQ